MGLVSGTCFAETGEKVTCVDIDKTEVEKLSAGQITIYDAVRRSGGGCRDYLFSITYTTGCRRQCGFKICIGGCGSFSKDLKRL